VDKAREYLTDDITIKHAVQALTEVWNSDEATTIEALQSAISKYAATSNDFGLFYKKDTTTIPNKELKRIDCFMWGSIAFKYLYRVLENKNKWDGINVDPDDCDAELITKTKDGEETIYQGTKYEKKIPRVKEDIKKYTGKPIPFREFQCKKVELGILLKSEGLDIPATWGTIELDRAISALIDINKIDVADNINEILVTGDKPIETYVFTEHGSGWHIGPKNNPVYVDKKRKGFLYLRCLMRSPGKQISAYEVFTAINGTLSPDKEHASMTNQKLGEMGLTKQAEMGTRPSNEDDAADLKALKAGLIEIDEDIRQAEEIGDYEEKESLKQGKLEILKMYDPLTESNGKLRKNIRIQTSPQEKARINISMNIRNALADLRDAEGGSDIYNFINNRLHIGHLLS